MEKREEIKEAVKSEVIKLMAQELIKENSFDAIKAELASELFNLEKEVKEIEKEVKETEQKIVKTRKLNKGWGYDPINKKEEKIKQEFGFLYNPKDIKNGFKGQEITEEEEKFMLESVFTKKALIEELNSKILSLKNDIEGKDEKEIYEGRSKLTTNFKPMQINNKFIDTTNFNATPASEKLADFKAKLYGEFSDSSTLNLDLDSFKSKISETKNEHLNNAVEKIFESIPEAPVSEDKPSIPEVKPKKKTTKKKTVKKKTTKKKK